MSLILKIYDPSKNLSTHHQKIATSSNQLLNLEGLVQEVAQLRDREVLSSNPDKNYKK